MGAPAGIASPRGPGRASRSVRRHITTRPASGSTSPNDHAGMFSQRDRTRAPEHVRRCMYAGADRTRSRPAVLRGPSAARPRRLPPLFTASYVTGRGWVLPRTANEAPSALADGAEARGSEKRASAAKLAGLRDRRRQQRRQAQHASACGKTSSSTTKTYPVAAGIAAGGSVEPQDFRGFPDVRYCLREMPTVGSPVGSSVGIF